MSSFWVSILQNLPFPVRVMEYFEQTAPHSELVPGVTRSSATIILTIYDRQILFFLIDMQILPSDEQPLTLKSDMLTHWGRATHICVSKLTIIASDNGLSPGRRQAIIWNSAGILSIGLLGTNFSEILIKILTYSFKEMRLEVSSAKWRPFCLGLNVLNSDLCLFFF